MPISVSAQAVLDAPPEKVFDTLTQLVCRLLKVPVALVTILDEDRQFFKSQQGLPEPWASRRETPLSHSFCQHVVAKGEPFIVEDARIDPRVRENLAIPDIGVIAYLGVPLYDDEKHTYGALCAIGNEPRQWTATDRETLETIATQVMGEITLRARFHAHREEQRQERLQAAVVRNDFDRLAAVFEQSPSFLAVLRGPEHVFHRVNEQYQSLAGRRELLGKPFGVAMPEMVPQGVVDLLDRVYHSGEPYKAKDARRFFQQEPGAPLQERFVDIVYLPTRSADGAVDGVVVHGVDWTERKHAQQTADELSDQRRLALDSARMGWWHLDMASRQLQMDQRFCDIFDLTERSGAYAEVLRRIHPEDRDWVDAAVQASTRAVNPVPYAVEYRVVHHDGSVHWVASKGHGVYEGEKSERRLVSFSGTTVDITEERTASAALRESEARYRSLFNSIDEAFAVLEIIRDEADRPVDYRFVEVNPALERHTGWKDARGHTARELIPNLEAHWPETYGRVERTGESTRFVQGAEGMGRVFDAYAFRIGNAERPQVAVLFQDVTERRANVAMLAQLSEQRGLALDSAQMGWWHLDPANGTVDWDERARKLYGLTDERVPYAQAVATIHPDDLAARDAAFQAASRSDAPQVPYETEYRVQHPDGSWRWLQIRGKATFAGEGAARHATSLDGTVVDITAAKEAQEALRESEARYRQLADSERAARTETERTSRMKDEFLATLSHELRTPLNAILGWAQVLRGDPSDVQGVEAGLATIERNARAQTQIIEDLLDMSKIISGKVRLDVQPLHLDQVVAATVDTMRPAAAAKNIRLQALIDPQARMINGDPNRLQQVFWNLLSNAIKFTPKGGKVQVVLERVHSHLEVCVADTGEGIAAEFLPYVFDRFRQQDASITRKHGGLGLGLAIVKQLVELHGGSIKVESAGPGEGTTFCVQLPLSVVQPTSPEVDVEHQHPASGAATLSLPAELLNFSGIKVLVVDDEFDARMLVKRLLEDRHATVHAAGSVAEAFAVFQAERPDVLISDIGMPGEDGYALIRRVRALPPEEGGTTPAVALTAYARPEDRLKTVLAGFEMHLSKPINTVELLAWVAKLAKRVGGS